ncbi:MAG: autotransporter outer membrane beta-barrel domain-containing protein, partial [Alphaproteobacteria bacterium]|nr:autotransporter outer membrane beta-barrel domain-containing protein [Alphaproteobacteria bacterium]
KGITGTSAITFASGTTLNATLDKTTIEASSVTFAGDNKLNLTVANGMAGDDYDFIDAATLTGEENVTIADNAIYNLTLTDEGKINVAVKSAHEIVENIDVPVAKQEAETLTAIISSNGNGTGVGNSIADAISAAMQSGNSAAAVQAVKDLAPTTSQQVMGVAQGVNNMLSNVTGGRMAAVSGRSGGDMFKGGSAWAQGLYNRTKQNTTADGAGFKADSAGFAMGIDGKVNDDLTIGFGYGFTRTDADSTGRTVDVDGHNFFVYGSYQPNAWYVDTMLSYGIGKYTEKKAPMGVAMTAKYDVNTFAANIMSGYGFNNGITPEGGIRYIYADQEAYNDGAQRISTDGSDVLTAVMGVKYEKDIPVSNYKVKPSLRLAATYDLVSDNSKANINVIGGGSYEIVGKRLNRLGAEVGAGVTGTFGKWDLSLEYNGGFRQNYQSHTGLIKAQYNF